MMTTFSFLIPLTLNMVYFCTGSGESFGDRKEAGTRIVGWWKVAKEGTLLVGYLRLLADAWAWTTSRVTLFRLRFRRGEVQNGIGHRSWHMLSRLIRSAGGEVGDRITNHNEKENSSEPSYTRATAEHKGPISKPLVRSWPGLHQDS